METVERIRNSYHREQADAIVKIRQQLQKVDQQDLRHLQEIIKPYLHFRKQVDDFLQTYFVQTCTSACFQRELSACCSREGIITFFADLVITLLDTPDKETEALLEVLQQPDNGTKCIYLGPRGCRLRIEPIVCKLFICDQAQGEVFVRFPEAQQRWKALQAKAKTYKWPDQPVLFDELEQLFLNWGITSPLMYLHNSPGLLRIKKMAMNKK